MPAEERREQVAAGCDVLAPGLARTLVDRERERRRLLDAALAREDVGVHETRAVEQLVVAEPLGGSTARRTAPATDRASRYGASSSASRCCASSSRVCATGDARALEAPDRVADHVDPRHSHITPSGTTDLDLSPATCEPCRGHPAAGDRGNIVCRTGVVAAMTTIGFIGSGNIGGTLARLAVEHGYDVVVSNSRGPHTLVDLVAELGDRARAGTLRRLPRRATSWSCRCRSGRTATCLSHRSTARS